MGYFCPKKYITSPKTYTKDLSNINFNYLCENSPNVYVMFATISYFLRHITFVFLAQTLHTFYNSVPSKCKFSDFPALTLRFTMSFTLKISHFIFQSKGQFFSKFGSFFSVIREYSSVIF